MDERVWEGEHGEEKEMENVIVLEKEKMVGMWRESPLNTSIIKTKVKEGDGLATE